MGQKVHPIGFRLGIHHEFKSIGYYPKKQFAAILLQDLKLREALYKKLRPAGVGNIIIERSPSHIKITLYVVRPGIVIGRGGTGLEELKKYIVFLLGAKPKDKNQSKIDLKVEPIKEPNLNAYLVASNISEQLIKRMPYKRVMKQVVDRVMNARAKGIRIVLAGRIGGSEIGRRERVQSGKVTLSSIRENIDFASVPSLTKSGYIGVKVWINR